MLPRVVNLAKPLRVMSNVRTIFYDDYTRTHPKEIFVAYKKTLNDLPVPAGSWQENFDARNRKWNMFLLGNAAFFAFSMGMMYKTGCWDLHMHPNYKSLDIDPSIPLKEKYPDPMPQFLEPGQH